MTQEVQAKQNQQELPSTSRATSNDIEILSTETGHMVYNRIVDAVEKLSSTRIGQFVIERGDRVLRTVEETAKWGLPQEETDVQLDRPLPWIPFLGLIITLRLVRIWLSVGALIIGNGPIMPHDVVYFIQTRRRKLRAIRVHGLKVISEREATKSGEKDKSLMGKIGQLFSVAICRPGMHHETQRRIFVKRFMGEVPKENQVCPEQASQKRPREDDDSFDANLTCEQMIEKYANESSNDDSDYIPNIEEEEYTNEETTITSTNDTSMDTSNVSEDIQEESNKMEPEAPKESQMYTPQAIEEQGNNEAISFQKKPRKDESQEQREQGNNAAIVIQKEAPKEPQRDERPAAWEQENKAAVRRPHEESVEITEASTHSQATIPMPINEIKREPISDVESGNEQVQTPTENGPSNGAQNREEDVVRKAIITPKANNNLYLNLNGNDRQQKKSTPGHESAAMMQPNHVLPNFNATATARSPPNIQSGYIPVSILKKPIATTFEAAGHSTPKNDDEVTFTGIPFNQISSDSAPSSSSIRNKTNLQHPNRQHYRYRGKNRR